jgi:glycosyltransferase involved in cell wall biosynthesis
LSRIDVIIPSYNYGSFLDQCVDSVLSQVGVDVRVLIIDDASPDDTAAVAAALARSDPRVTFVRHSDNKGHIATYNEGIEWASADYMLILSADDYLLPGALERATNLMNARPEVGFAFGNYIELGVDGVERLVKRLEDSPNTLPERVIGGIEFIEMSGAHNLVGATCTAVVRTTLQQHLGGYPAELPHTGDMMMWLRFAAYASVGFVAAAQGVYRRHRANMSSPYYTMTGRLSELYQRKAALDYFYQTSSDTLPDVRRLRRKSFRSLGGMAVRFASIAFNENELDASRQLAEFALDVCPQIKRSSAWMQLSLKQRMGSGAWRALQPAVAAIRSARLTRQRTSVLTRDR